MKEFEQSLFPTSVWGFMFTSHKYQSKNYLDVILDLEKTVPSQHKSNKGGYQTEDDLNNHPIFRELVIEIENFANKIVSTTHPGSRVKMTEMWGNLNYEKDSNAAHTHGGVLSGVFYLETPKNSGDLILVNPAVRADGRMFRVGNYRIKPEPFALIMFPSWLEHYVEPNLSKQRRISISFNFDTV